MTSADPSLLARAHQLHGLQPVLPVADVAAAVAFYVNVLGFELDFQLGTPPQHARVRTGDGSYGQPIFIHLQRAEPSAVHPSGAFRLHVGHELDALYRVYLERGACVEEPPTDRPWGLREFVLKDPSGYRLYFCAER